MNHVSALYAANLEIVFISWAIVQRAMTAGLSAQAACQAAITTAGAVCNGIMPWGQDFYRQRSRV